MKQFIMNANHTNQTLHVCVHIHTRILVSVCLVHVCRHVSGCFVRVRIDTQYVFNKTKDSWKPQVLAMKVP
jgi:hypothetical protein